MVTFTEASAAEMRQRIRERLEEERDRHPKDTHVREQLALFEMAHIGTLHSFCLELVREHFYVLGIDPQAAVMREEESQLLAQEQLDRLLQDCYSGRHPKAQAVQSLIQGQVTGSEQRIRDLILELHEYGQSLPDPQGWFAKQLAHYQKKGAEKWAEWLPSGIRDWRTGWSPYLRELTSSNPVARDCLSELEGSKAERDRRALARMLERTLAACTHCPPGRKEELLGPLKEFRAEAEFLLSVTAEKEGTDPLEEDWNWVRGPMITLVELAIEFGEAFMAAKREGGLLDFHDLEQFALRLLWDNQKNKPTEIAQQWRDTFRYVFVDEYQDINAAQDRIVEALSREGTQANRFLVGDVKQSIYRFRLANPRIFQRYEQAWQEQGKVVALTENYRSREGILKFVNSLFSRIMYEPLGGVTYDERAQVRFGGMTATSHVAETSVQRWSGGSDDSPRVELHLRLKRGKNSGTPEGENGEKPTQLNDLEEADKEARLTGHRLLQLKKEGHLVREGDQERVMEWGDVAILLRSPAGKAETFAKAFSQLGIPLAVARLGFYENREITDLVSLLSILDNPLQDLPLWRYCVRRWSV